MQEKVSSSEYRTAFTFIIYFNMVTDVWTESNLYIVNTLGQLVICISEARGDENPIESLLKGIEVRVSYLSNVMPYYSWILQRTHWEENLNVMGGREILNSRGKARAKMFHPLFHREQLGRHGKFNTIWSCINNCVVFSQVEHFWVLYSFFGAGERNISHASWSSTRFWPIYGLCHWSVGPWCFSSTWGSATPPFTMWCLEKVSKLVSTKFH